PGCRLPGAATPVSYSLVRNPLWQLTLAVLFFTKYFSGKIMTYAVIRTGGKQYRVSEGDLVKVEKLPGEVGEQITIADVLFIGGDGDARIGAPLVPNAKVVGQIVS